MLPGYKFHHIGYAVQSIEATSRPYVEFGEWSCSEIFVDSIQNVKIAFLRKDDMPVIELVEPINEESPVVKTLEKSGVSPYHICYEVDDVDVAIKELKKLRFIPLFRPVPAIALDNRLICYLYNADLGLIEILNK